MQRARTLHDLLVCGRRVQAAHRQVVLRVVAELVAGPEHSSGHRRLADEPRPDGQHRGPHVRPLELMEHRPRDRRVTGPVEGQRDRRVRSASHAPALAPR